MTDRARWTPEQLRDAQTYGVCLLHEPAVPRTFQLELDEAGIGYDAIHVMQYVDPIAVYPHR